MDITHNLSEFLAWYLAPWRRIGRGPFNIVIGVVSVAPLVFTLGGLGEMVSSGGDALNAIQHINSGNLSAVPQLEQLVKNGLSGPTEVKVPWADMINAGLMLALIPLLRMRLRDIGWREPLSHFGGLVLVISPVFLPLLKGLGLEVPLGIMFSIMQFVVLGLLCVKAGEPTPERPLPPA